jgi:hypothetical protein
VIDTATATGWYVFGVTPAGADPPSGVRLIEHGPLAAIAGEVPLAEFGEDVLPERLNDRAWLEEKVRAHEDVLQSFLGEMPVVPLRFGAIYRHPVDVQRMLEERGAFFEAALARLRGRVELGVKAWFDPGRLPKLEAAGGRAYLERRRSELTSGRDASAFAAEAHERLAAVAVAAVANRPQPRELTGRTERMLLNGAYLVDVHDDALAREVGRLAEEGERLGVVLELTGPWPPYNFVGDEEERS